jgi:hypothetical protein
MSEFDISVFCGEYVDEAFPELLKSVSQAKQVAEGIRKLHPKYGEDFVMRETFEHFGLRECKEHFTLFKPDPEINNGFYISRCNQCIIDYETEEE